jgi:hypothetical protein
VHVSWVRRREGIEVREAAKLSVWIGPDIGMSLNTVVFLCVRRSRDIANLQVLMLGPWRAMGRVLIPKDGAES